MSPSEYRREQRLRLPPRSPPSDSSNAGDKRRREEQQRPLRPSIRFAGAHPEGRAPDFGAASSATEAAIQSPTGQRATPNAREGRVSTRSGIMSPAETDTVRPRKIMTRSGKYRFLTWFCRFPVPESHGVPWPGPSSVSDSLHALPMSRRVA